MEKDNENTTQSPLKIKGYKGFSPDMTCRDFQYEVGKEYETDEAKTCEEGFHFCENPFDVWSYYPPCDEKGQLNRFCKVDGSGDIDNSHSDKIACSHIKINAEIGLQGIINAGVKFIMDKVSRSGSKQSNTGNRSAATNTGNRSAATNTGDRSAATNTGDQSAATNTGYRSAATNTGYRSAATNTGYQSAATNTGDQSAATNTGYQSAATNTGYRSAATNTGFQSVATNTGNYSAATNTGDQSAATNTGCRSAASVGGHESIAIVTGKDSMAKGAPGCWIVLTERAGWDGEAYPIKCIKAFKVDGEKIKPDTFYKLENGEAVEVKE